MGRRKQTGGPLGLLILTGLATAGCHPEVPSRAAADCAGLPKRMEMVAVKGPLTQAPEWAAFRDGVRQKLGECGVVVELVEPRTRAAAQEPRSGPAIGGFDAVLRISPVASFGVQNASGQSFLRSVTYEAVVTEQPSGRAVFRGQVGVVVRSLLREPGEGGHRSAGALVRQLARDGTVRTCPAATIADPNFVPAVR